MPYDTLFIDDKCHTSYGCETQHPLANSVSLERLLVNITKNGILIIMKLLFQWDIKNLTQITHRQFLLLNKSFLFFDRVWTDTDNLNFTRFKSVLLLITPPVNIFQTIIEMNRPLPAIAFRNWQACFVHPYEPKALYIRERR